MAHSRPRRTKRSADRELAVEAPHPASSIDRRDFLRAAAGAALLGASALPLPGRALGAVPIVATARGRVRGAVVNGCEVFRGIPYGASTDGTARFRAPSPAPEWSGIRDAVSNGDRCPQGPEARAEGPMSEDCLALNVWTPSSSSATKRPVMVWLHPGGYHGGAGYQYTGNGNLAKRGDIVQVEVNHRLNVFGYLHLADIDAGFADAGNAGMLDIIAALEWVRDNIDAFGGDPSNVTIFGESGGGGKVSTLMAMPAARGLFHKAIAQSGFALRAADRESAARASVTLLDELGVGRDIGALQQISTERLLTAFRKVRQPGAYRPVVDGTHLPHDPWHPTAPPESADVPLMLGVTRDETTILLGMLGGDIDAMWKMGEVELNERLAAYLSTTQEETTAIVATYRARWPAARPADLFFRITSDRMMRLPSILQAERKAAQSGAPAYLYLFSWESPAFGPGMGAHHGAELNFVFDTVTEQAERIGIGEDRRQLADAMLGAWSRFAHTGDPNHSGLPEWEPYSTAHRDTLVFDMPSRAERDPLGAEREAMAPILERALAG